MILRNYIKFLIILSALCVTNVSYAHRFYASFSQIEMQPAKGTIEITHRLFTHDIEDLLTRYQGTTGELEDQVIEKFLQDYIIDAFGLYDVDGQIIPVNWIGIDVTLDDIYIYQEALLKEGQQSLIIADRILMDIFEDQSNTVNLKRDSKVKSYTFNDDTVLYKFDFNGSSGVVTPSK